jgi:hypothetical protein
MGDRLGTTGVVDFFGKKFATFSRFLKVLVPFEGNKKSFLCKNFHLRHTDLIA